ncbi:hypothetical protein [Algoriphagus aquimarinus]|uniref:Uncharacterized protein n=1 Tax=Algoriphagus aquimarinus TaxID=237018 RepID=A0A5C7AGG8_9BACT|nr:hypothetical protein [Algoriphagus aquimarinus]TXE03088.1 hypothetical protein ESV85_20710 [Algoriphagus aquimarinus]
MKPKEYVSITEQLQDMYPEKSKLEVLCMAIEIESQLNEASGETSLKDYPISIEGALMGFAHGDDGVKDALINFLLAFDRDFKKSEE